MPVAKPMLKLASRAISAAVFCWSSLAAATNPDVYDLMSLQGLSYGDAKGGDAQYIAPSSDEGQQQEAAQRNLRLAAMKESAISLGAQHGYVSRLDGHKAYFETHPEIFDIFDFDLIMRLAAPGDEEMYLLPPVIQRLDNVSAVSESATRVRISGLVHVIKRPARLVLNPPDWRQYLIWDEEVAVQQPSKALLPKTAEEQAMWSRWVAEGWKWGVLTADDEMRFRIRRLGEDFNGMVRYMTLAFQGKVKRPFIASQHTPVVGGGTEMRENESVYEISIPAQLHPQASDWDPIFGDGRQSLRYPSEGGNYSADDASGYLVEETQ